MNNKRIITLCAALALTLSSAICAGCGSSSSYAAKNEAEYMTTESAVGNSWDSYEADYSAEEMAYEDDYSQAEMPAESAADSEAVSEVVDKRKLIRTVNMSVETVTYDELFTNIKTKLNKLGGYIENMDESVDTWSSEETRHLSLTIRVPKVKADELISDVENLARTTSRSENIEDVTLSYVDMESHKNALLAEQKRLEELMARAESVEDLITIEDRLSEVRYRIESMESQLRAYDNRIDYTTIYLNINEVYEITPEPEPGFFGKIKFGFTENFFGAIDFVLDFVSGLIINIPYIILWIVMIAIIFNLIVRPLLRYKDRFRAMRRAEKEAAQNKVKGLNKADSLNKTDSLNKADSHDKSAGANNGANTNEGAATGEAESAGEAEPINATEQANEAGTSE